MIRRIAVLAALPGPALAHGTLPGGGGFYAGLAHPFLAVEHFVLLLSLGLLLGRLGSPVPRSGLLALTGGLLAGLLLRFEAALATPAVLALALVCGGALALGRAPGHWAPGLAALAGLAVGADTGLPATDPAADAVTALMPWLGVLAGGLLVVANAMALAGLVARHPTGQTGLRIAGSWIAAIALMVLTLHLSQAMPA